MGCCLRAPSHYMNQCWFIIQGILWHLPVSNSTGSAHENDIEYNDYGGQWIILWTHKDTPYCTFMDELFQRVSVTIVLQKADNVTMALAQNHWNVHHSRNYVVTEYCMCQPAANLLVDKFMILLVVQLGSTPTRVKKKTLWCTIRSHLCDGTPDITILVHHSSAYFRPTWNNVGTSLVNLLQAYMKQYWYIIHQLTSGLHETILYSYCG